MPLELMVPAIALVWFVVWALRRARSYGSEPSDLAKALPRILKAADPYSGPIVLAERTERVKGLFL